MANEDDTIDIMLQYMVDENFIATRMNRKTKVQEFIITWKGEDILKMLKFFSGEIS